MKKYFVLLCAVAAFAACGGGNQPKQAPGTIAVDPVVQQGKDLITKSDCRTCHQDETKLIGPAYKDVANKYAASDSMVTHLAGKIITGGTGVWGNVAMTPHPALSKADAETMLKYIFSLKTN
jgi:Cytochrome c551/c552